MKKVYKLLILGIFIANLSPLFANVIGEQEFLSNINFYINSKENIESIDDVNIKKKLDIIREYESYRDIEIFKYLKNREFAISFSGENSKNFAIIFRIKQSDFLMSNYYENSQFDKEIIQGITIYYNIIGREFAYTYVDELLYISNNINVFFDIMNNVSYPKNNLQKNDFFSKFKPLNKDYLYFYYLNESGNIKNYEYSSKLIINFGENMEKIYNINSLNKEFNEKLYNFSDFISDDISDIYYGRDLGVIIEDMKTKYNYIVNKDSDITRYKGLLLDDIIVKVGTNSGASYFIIYASTNKDELIEKIRTIFEKEFFYNKKLNLQNGENGVRYINIPLFDKKIYINFIKSDYLVITENKEVYDNIIMEKYYNFDYSYLSNKKEYYENFINGEKKIVEIGKGYLREQF